MQGVESRPAKFQCLGARRDAIDDHRGAFLLRRFEGAWSVRHATDVPRHDAADLFFTFV